MDRHCGVPTPSSHVTRLPNSRIKMFYPSVLDQQNWSFSQPKVGNKIKQNQATNHTLEKKKPMIGGDFTYLG